MGNRNYLSTVTERTLAAAMSSSTAGTTSSMQLNTTSAVPAFPFTMVIAPDTTAEEIVTVTGLDTPANTFLVTRGQEGTAAVAHGTTTDGSSTKVRHMITARDLQEAQDHFDDTTSVHGIADTSLLTTAGNTQTLTNKTLTGPAINTPTISNGSMSNTTVNGATLTGTITNNGTINGGNITGAALSGSTQITGATLAGTTTNSGTITGGTVAGSVTNTATITGGTINPATLKQNSINVPLAFSSGTGTFSPGGTVSGTATITLPASRFTVTPVVVVTCENSAFNMAANPVSTGLSSWTITGRHIDGSSTSGTYTFYWMAIQQTGTAYTAGTAQ